jgi:hypothetical protein
VTNPLRKLMAERERVNALEQQLREARISEARAVAALERAESAGQRDTIPAPALTRVVRNG